VTFILVVLYIVVFVNIIQNKPINIEIEVYEDLLFV